VAEQPGQADLRWGAAEGFGGGEDGRLVGYLGGVGQRAAQREVGYPGNPRLGAQLQHVLVAAGDEAVFVLHAGDARRECVAQFVQGHTAQSDRADLAGVTVGAGLRRGGARPGARVAVSGIGGLGHLAIEYAKAAGYHVTAVTRTPDKRDLALQLGADEVAASGAALKKAGGADLLMHTNSSHAAVADAMEGLRPWGKVLVNGIGFDDMTLPMLSLVSNSYQVIGSAHNGLEYLAEALGFVARGEVKPMVEDFPKEDIKQAVAKAASGDVRFKAVVTY